MSRRRRPRRAARGTRSASAISRPVRAPQRISLEWPLLLGAGASVALVVATASGHTTWGSLAGGWVYPYVRGPATSSLLAVAVVLPAALALALFSLRRIEEHEVSTLVLCFGAGLILQALLRWPVPFPLEALVRSDTANGFYTPSLQYGFHEFLQLAGQDREALPLHPRGNMPGKVALYMAFGLLTRSTLLMGYGVIAVSNLGGILLYAIARRLSDRRTALFALFFYLFLPSKLFFFPLLNTVSAVPVLLVLWLHLRFLQQRRPLDALLLGVALYGAFFFDPLPLALGLVFAAFGLAALRAGEVTGADAVRQVGMAAAGFAAVHGIFWLGFGYEIFSHFAAAVAHAREFNVSAGRDYTVWLLANPVEFALGLGAPQVAILLATLLGVFLAPRGGRASRFFEPAALTAWSLFAVLAFLDLAGANRGEVLRLWIFLGSCVPLVTAHYCARSESPWPFGIVLGLLVLEAAVPLGMVGFVIPFDLLPPGTGG